MARCIMVQGTMSGAGKSLLALSLIHIFAALTGDAQAPLLPRAVLVLCADNGVVAQGVTQTDSSVTAAVTRNLAEMCIRDSFNISCFFSGAAQLASASQVSA